MPNLAFSLMKKQKCQHKGPRLVKTWFNQPGRAARRHQARVKKAERMFPRPTEALRPVVQCCGIMHNIYQRAGRGFSLAELKAAKLSTLRARQLGIAVDTRRVNKNQQSLDANVARLQEYKNRLVIFKKDAKPEEIKAAVQATTPLKITKAPVTIATAKVADMPKINAYETLHNMRINRLASRKNEAARRVRAAKTQKK